MLRRSKFLRAVWNAALYYARQNRLERIASASGVPEGAMLTEDGLPMMAEDGSYLLTEG